MLFYWIASFVKIVGGSIILWITYNYIDIESDFIIGVIVGSLGFGFMIWGLLFFVFYIIGRLFSNLSNLALANKIYKYTLLIALYIFVNILLIFFEFWNKWIGLGILLLFVLLGLVW